jgi:hypothetical protein
LEQIDFESLSLSRSQIERIEVLREREGHLVCRFFSGDRSLILKWFRSPAESLEFRIYTLLGRLGVPTLRVIEQTGQALLLEDLQSSSAWRLAKEEDMSKAETGMAVAAWYRELHQAGQRALSDPALDTSFLHPWVRVITPEALARTGAIFGLSEKAAWKTALASAGPLLARYLSLPQTFNYADFAGENLALSAAGQRPFRAVVFDYDCFATGCVYSDWRNVVYSLEGEASDAFKEAYGPVSEAERRLDEPLSILEGLVVAGQRKVVPAWANPLFDAVLNGELERAIRSATE